MYYTKVDKINIILDIIKKLKTFPSVNETTINLYNDQYLFYSRFKELSNKWINEDKSYFSGKIYFEELGTHFEYIFPKETCDEPLFVLRKKNY